MPLSDGEAEEPGVGMEKPDTSQGVSEHNQNTAATDSAKDQTTDERSRDKDADDPRTEMYFWCKCPCDPAQYNGITHYYLHLKTSESRWDEPDEPYWLFDPLTGQPDPTSLQQPKQKAVANPQKIANAPVDRTENNLSGPPDDYQGYNPKVHGNYDPNAPYAKYHENKRKQEEDAEHRAKFGDAPAPGEEYGTAATFNRATGAFQNADQSAERHSDASKSYRQLHAFYDVDAAANTHNGQSLKAARQQQKYSKKEIQEMNARRKEKKMKKRLDWLKS